MASSSPKPGEPPIDRGVVGRLAARVVKALPHGGRLRADAWQRRRRGILWLLWLCVPVLAAFGLYGGHDTLLMFAAFILGLSTAELVHWQSTERAHQGTEAHAEELEQALSLHKATLESTTDGLLVVDRKGKITAYNQRFREMWEIPPEVLETGDDETALAHVVQALEAPEAFLSKVRELDDAPEAKSLDELRLKDGRVFERLSQPQRIGAEVVGRVWSFRDVTEARRDQADQAERAEALARSNEELERFAYICSHDLQEPLRMVSSYVQLVDQRYRDELDEDGRAFLGYASEGAARARELVNGLLAYSRIDREGDRLEDVKLQVVLDTVLADLRVTLDQNLAEVTHDQLPTVRGDPVQLAQLFQNLLSNAVKFQPTMGAKVHISADQDGGTWRIGVHDNGIGIEPAYHERIFTIFQRLNDRDRFPGTGVGLAICKRIVERHDGRIWVESEPSEGATFHVSLPAATA